MNSSSPGTACTALAMVSVEQAVSSWLLKRPRAPGASDVAKDLAASTNAPWRSSAWPSPPARVVAAGAGVAAGRGVGVGTAAVGLGVAGTGVGGGGVAVAAGAGVGVAAV